MVNGEPSTIDATNQIRQMQIETEDRDESMRGNITVCERALPRRMATEF